MSLLISCILVNTNLDSFIPSQSYSSSSSVAHFQSSTTFSNTISIASHSKLGTILPLPPKALRICSIFCHLPNNITLYPFWFYGPVLSLDETHRCQWELYTSESRTVTLKPDTEPKALGLPTFSASSFSETVSWTCDGLGPIPQNIHNIFRILHRCA